MGLRVLLIDGQPDTRHLVTTKLAQAGFRVSTALEGQEGLDKALTEKPAVILLHAPIQGQDASTLTREIRRRLPDHAPVIILLSSQGEVADIAEAFRSGIDDYIVKPFAPRELIERVVVALVRRERTAELLDTLGTNQAIACTRAHDAPE